MNTYLGHGEAAEQNRRHLERKQILAALCKVGIPRGKWPGFVLSYERTVPEKALYRQLISPAPFRPPDFDRLNESPEEWRKKAEESWQEHRDRFLKAQRYWSEKGVDEKITRAKHRRGPGRAQGQRKNTALDLRYELAARRLCGELWKQIAADYGIEVSTVRKAGSEVLKSAGWFRHASGPGVPS